MPVDVCDLDLQALIEEGVPRDVIERTVERWLYEREGEDIDGYGILVRREVESGVVWSLESA